MSDDKPKRPLSSYMLWLNSARESIKRENPGLKVTEVAKKGGELWRAMEDKTEWEQKAAEVKEKYTNDLASYNARFANGRGDPGRNAPVKKAPAKKAPAKNPVSAKKTLIVSSEEDDSD